MQGATKSPIHTNTEPLKYTDERTPRAEDALKDTHKPSRGLLAAELRGICWTARDCVMAAPPLPVSCVCAGTWWR